MTTISILGVSIGVAALVVVLSVMGGFETDLRDKMFRGLPHMEIFSENAQAGFSLQQHSRDQVLGLFPEALGVEPFTKSDVVLKHRKSLSSATLFGIDPDLGGKLWGFFSGTYSGDLSGLIDVPKDSELSGGIFLGDSLAIQLGVGIGEDIFILSPHAGVGDVLGGGHISGQFRVVGIFQTDLPQFDNKYAVVSLAAGRKFLPDYDFSLDEEEYVSGIAVSFRHPEEIDEYKARLQSVSDLQPVTWKDTNSSLLFALKLEKFTMSAILLLIVLVAAFSISGTIMMTVFHKRSQIALFRAIGMSRRDVARLYLSIGLTIGTIGAGIGLIIGLAACLTVYYFQFIDLPTGIYYQSKLPVKFLPLEYIVIVLSAWVLSLLATFYPSIIAAREDPGIGLRFL